MVVTQAGTSPTNGGLLYGTPDLFQRLYSQDSRVALAGPEQARRPGLGGLLLSKAVPTLSAAVQSVDLEALIAEGEDLFFNATFSGNGRTCGTCHPAQNNFTIDPAFIRTLPCEDPLFVAEHAADRKACRAAPRQHKSLAKNFENPTLMRKFGLILENNDGMGDLENNFNMRGVPHIFSQPLSLTPQTGSSGSATTPPSERTGWSGDGAPFGQIGQLTTTGSLRDFAVGAVIQHFPKTTNREIGEDFVLPTPDQLTAMEAFQRSVGRQAELNLATMVFTDTEVSAGRDVFNSDRSSCAVCHFNGGATAIFAPGENRNFDTNVEEFLANNPDGTGEPRHPDGGFGITPAGDFTNLPVANTDGSFGNGEFNTPSLHEFADALPAFHNNITASGPLDNTVEGTIRFYLSDEFDTSPARTSPFGVPPVTLTDLEVMQLGKLLRVLNALFNEETASSHCDRARRIVESGRGTGRVNTLLRVAIAEVDDAIEVFEGASLHSSARHHFSMARKQLTRVIRTRRANRQLKSIETALDQLALARADMITE